MLRRQEEILMATKKKHPKKSPQNRPEASLETGDRGAPSGRGGVAMGRTVGLPFGGARPRKRKAKATKRESHP